MAMLYPIEGWLDGRELLVAAVVLGAITSLAAFSRARQPYWLVGWLFYLGTLVPSIAGGIRRMHDNDKSGWFILIPIYNLILAFSEGTKGPNRFGADPKDATSASVFA